MTEETNIELGLISVIIPVYNTEKYLDRCIESVINQTYHKLEIILINDGSTDSSPILCDKWKKIDKRVKVIHKQNGGQSSARNMGLNVAKGQYIGFVDSDDYITEDMYEFLLRLIKKYNADISMCDYARYERKLDRKNKHKNIVTYSEKDMVNLFYRLNGERSMYSICNRLYSKKILQDIKFMEGKTTEDVLFIYEIYGKAKKMVYSPLKKYLYYINISGTTRSALCMKDYSLIEIWDEIVKREQKKEFYEAALLNRKRAVFTLFVKALIYGRSREISDNQLIEWRKEIKNNSHDLKVILDWKRRLLLWFICSTDCIKIKSERLLQL